MYGLHAVICRFIIKQLHVGDKKIVTIFESTFQEAKFLQIILCVKQPTSLHMIITSRTHFSKDVELFT